MCRAVDRPGEGCSCQSTEDCRQSLEKPCNSYQEGKRICSRRTTARPGGCRETVLTYEVTTRALSPSGNLRRHVGPCWKPNPRTEGPICAGLFYWRSAPQEHGKVWVLCKPFLSWNPLASLACRKCDGS